jgi:hypothetical protein
MSNLKSRTAALEAQKEADAKRARKRAYNQAWAAAQGPDYKAKRHAAYLKRAEVQKAKNKANRIVNRDALRARAAAKYAADAEARRAKARASYEKNRAACLARGKANQRSRTQSTPAWVDQKAIRAFWKACPSDCHVDHIIPIKAVDWLGHRVASGLNVVWNLQYLPQPDNMKKRNRMQPVDADMPVYTPGCDWQAMMLARLEVLQGRPALPAIRKRRLPPPDAATIAKRKANKKALHKAWVEANAERQRIKGQERYARTGEAQKARQKAARAADPVKARAAAKALRDTKRQLLNEQYRAYYAANADHLKAQRNARNAAKRAALPPKASQVAWNKGVPMSEAQKLKLRKPRSYRVIRKPHSEATKAKIAAKALGRVRSAATSAKQAAALRATNARKRGGEAYDKATAAARYYEENRDAIIAKRKAREAVSPPRVRLNRPAQSAAYLARHRDAIYTRRKARYNANKDAINAARRLKKVA